MSKGLDYSWGRPNVSEMVAKGYKFAARYLSNNVDGKNITREESDALRAVGMAIVLVWESYVKRPLEGNAAGIADAQKSLEEARAIGFPDSVPIYFAVDFDAYEAQQAAIDDYLRGAASVLGAERIGIYGGFYVVKRCIEGGTAKFGWQTLAWSGGQTYQGAHIYQNGATDFGGQADVNDILKDNYGQWGSDVEAHPNTPPAPAAPSQNSYTVVAGDTLSGIASRFGTTYQHLAAINGISDPNKISIGQVIKLSDTAPNPQPNGTVYTVKSGDTLSGIGMVYGVDYHTIAQINGLSDPNKIYVGQTLRIPGGVAPAPTVGGTFYTVQSGDTLSGIASKYGTTYTHIAQINGIADPNKIFPNQVLKIS